MGSYIAGAVVLLLVGVAIRTVYMDKKRGKSCSCGCGGCSNCPSMNNRKP